MDSRQPEFGKIVVFGTGLIGGSFASAACLPSGAVLVADDAFRAWLIGLMQTCI